MSTGKGKHLHPIQEASKAAAKLDEIRDKLDELLVLCFESTNMEPYPFSWVGPQETTRDYSSVLVLARHGRYWVPTVLNFVAAPTPLLAPRRPIFRGRTRHPPWSALWRSLCPSPQRADRDNSHIAGRGDMSTAQADQQSVTGSQARRVVGHQQMLVGAVCCVAAIVFAAVSYHSASGAGTYLVASAAILFGAVQFFLGMAHAVDI